MGKNLKKVKRGYKFVLVDGQNLCKRMYHVRQYLKSHDGHPTNILFGVLNFVATMQNEHPEAHIIFCWEGQNYSVRQTKKGGSYKQSRTHADLDYMARVNELKDVLPLTGVYQCFQPGLEADDIMGYFATQKSGRKLIVSRDRDLWQHVSKNVDIKDVNEIKDEQYLTDFLGYPVANIIMWKILKGDKSDDVKGILRFPLALANHISKTCNTLTDLKNSIENDDWVEPKYEKWRAKLKAEWETLEDNDYLMRFHPEWVEMDKVIKTRPNRDNKLLLKVIQHRSMFSLVSRFRITGITLK